MMKKVFFLIPELTLLGCAAMLAGLNNIFPPLMITVASVSVSIAAVLLYYKLDDAYKSMNQKQ